MAYAVIQNQENGNVIDPDDINQLMDNTAAHESRIGALESSPASMPMGYLYGLILSNAADTEHDITIAVGACRDSSNGYNLTLSSAMTKRIDAGWSAGSTNGGLDTGSVAASTEYFVWLIRKDSDGTIDALFSASSTAPTMPAGYTYKRLLRGVRTDSSANIVNNQWLITDVANDRSANMIVREEQAANTQGGTFTNGAWRTRVLNTVKINEIPGASLASNQITLPAGQYKITALAPSNYTTSTKARIYDITNSADLIIGPSNYNEQSTVVTVTDLVIGVITLSGATVIELQHRCTDSYSTYGFGRAANLDSKVEVYSQIKIQKIG
jgi:hypothetical protein